MEYFAATDIGRKYRTNEDFFALPENDESYGISPDTSNYGHLFLLCDGVGGANAGEVASQLAAKWTIRDYYSLPEVPAEPLTALDGVVRDVNTRIHELASTHGSYRGMGSTIVAALFLRKNLYVVSAGDSRLYRFREGTLEQLTEDHSEVWTLYKKGLLSKDELRHHARSNIITEAIGSGKDINPFKAGFEVEEGDLYLLCSDGLTDMLGDSGVEEVLLMTDLDLQATTSKLISRANEEGGKDNITVVLVRF